jgi:8-amino-3,8-dideoxy-alpha-D-manno-octulosonate transaminase
MKRKMELAMDGGTPIRQKPYPYKLPGASMIGQEELQELKDVVEQKSPFRHYGYGTPCKVNEFERQASEMLGAQYTLGVSSGTGALFCAVAALGIGPGDEVILPAFGWFSDYEAIVAMGGTPVFSQIDDTMNLDPVDFERKITPATKAVIVIHYQGGAARMDEICAVAARHNIRIIEDCAQAFGGSYGDKMLGTLGDIGISSFQTNKMLTCGEGGILYTNDEKLYARAVRYHDLGMIRDTFIKRLDNKDLASVDESFSGCQFRMSELQGAFILAQMKKLPYILERCRKAQKRIKDAFKDTEYFTFRPTVGDDCGITLFLRFKTSEEADFFVNALAAEGAPASKSSACCNLMGQNSVLLGKTANSNTVDFKVEHSVSIVSDKILAQYVPIALGPLYTEEDISDIIKSIRKIIKYLEGTTKAI